MHFSLNDAHNKSVWPRTLLSWCSHGLSASTPSLRLLMPPNQLPSCTHLLGCRKPTLIPFMTSSRSLPSTLLRSCSQELSAALTNLCLLKAKLLIPSCPQHLDHHRRACSRVIQVQMIYSYDPRRLQCSTSTSPCHQILSTLR